MTFYYLTEELRRALENLNLNYLTEIRLRNGQPVIIRFRGEYNYINSFGITSDCDNAIICNDAGKCLYAAMENSVYAYTEQLKRGFITVDGGVRIGIGGEYVTQGGDTVTVKNVTSLNLRIPHDVVGAANELYGHVCNGEIFNTLLFSRPGYGKTTLLRDIARNIARKTQLNVLVFDERNEIAAVDGDGRGYDLGKGCDIIRGADKLTAFSNAVRAMSPQVIITDELYGAEDLLAAQYAADCGISIIASSHTVDREQLKKMPFSRYVELSGAGKQAVIYDKDFNIVCHCSTVGRVGNSGGN